MVCDKCLFQTQFLLCNIIASRRANMGDTAVVLRKLFDEELS